MCVEFFNVFNVCRNSHRWFIYPSLWWCWCPEIGTSTIDWAQLSRLLPEDRIQSLKCCVLNKIQDDEIMSKNRIIVKVLRLREIWWGFFFFFAFVSLISDEQFLENQRRMIQALCKVADHYKLKLNSHDNFMKFY
jgi:hypothetical protein